MNKEIDEYRSKIVTRSGLIIFFTVVAVAATLCFIEIDGVSIIRFLVNYYLSKA